MRKITSVILFLLPAFLLTASPFLPADTTFQYHNRKVVIRDNPEGMNITVYHLDAQGDTIRDSKLYEGIFTEEKSIERRYETGFEISVPDIFKPREERCESRSQWAGFGIGFTNLPEGLDFNGELSSVLHLSRSLQYNLNLLEGSWQMGNSNFYGVTGMGIQFNSIHFQRNKAIEVVDYRSVITTTEAGEEYNNSRLHYTYLTFPFLVETSWDLGQRSFFFINAGLVAKVKTASSSKVWYPDENGKEQRMKFPGDLNIRPLTCDVLIQAGYNNAGIFAAYAPLALFRENRGPVAHQVTFGLQLYF